MDKEKNLDKKLYVEPIENYKKRRNVYFNFMLIPVFLLIITIIIFLIFIIHPIEDGNPYLVLVIGIPLGLFGLLGFYYLNYKPFNRFIMYEDGFYEQFTKKFIYYNEIKYIIIDHYRYQEACINVYYGDGGHECYSGIPKQEIKKIKKIYMQKGILEKKKRTSIWE